MKKQIKRMLLPNVMACTVLLTLAGCVNDADNDETSINSTDVSETLYGVETGQNETSAIASENEQDTSATDEASGTSSLTESVLTTDQDETKFSEKFNEEQSSAINSDAPTMQEATNIIGALDLIDKIGACAIPYDENASYSSESGTKYFKVKAQFTSTSDVREYMNDFMTKDFIADRYSSILDTAEPMCIDVDGELYIFSETSPAIENTFDGGYSILAEYDSFGSKEVMDILVINADGIWKICGITFGI